MSASSSTELPSGLQIDHFRVQGLLGKGGMGSVYEAEDVNLGRRVALKVLSPALLEIEGYRDRFFREARSAARVQHPNIVSIYHLGETGGRPYYAMEYVDGEPLDEVLRRERQFSEARAVELLTPVLEALHHAQQQGVIHRDLKPANLVLGRDGRVRILDFGLARMEGSTSLTNTGMVMGTPDYMAPEQGLGKKVTHTADIYAIGVIFYTFLSGRLPFEGDSALEVMMAHVQTPPLRLEKLLPSLSPELAQIIHRCLEKRPVDRYQDYPSLIQDLRQGPTWKAQVVAPSLIETAQPRAAQRALEPNPEFPSGATQVRGSSDPGLSGPKDSTQLSDSKPHLETARTTPQISTSGVTRVSGATSSPAKTPLEASGFEAPALPVDPISPWTCVQVVHSPLKTFTHLLRQPGDFVVEFGYRHKVPLALGILLGGLRVGGEILIVAPFFLGGLLGVCTPLTWLIARLFGNPLGFRQTLILELGVVSTLLTFGVVGNLSFLFFLFSQVALFYFLVRGQAARVLEGTKALESRSETDQA